MVKLLNIKNLLLINRYKRRLISKHAIIIACLLFSNNLFEKDGKITDVKALRDFKNCLECDKEAILLIKKMPRWTPGMQFGKVVRVQFNIPIKFMLR